MRQNLRKYFICSKIRRTGLAAICICSAISAAEEIDEVVVLAPKIEGTSIELTELRRQSANVSEVLSQEQMSRSGDSDAGSSLRRVTGLTLMNGKYIYIRGMGERYSSATLNDAILPSPEPARRVVPLDLFPVSILDSVLVQKSYSSRLSGEFGGGVIQLKTKSFPEKNFIKVSLSQNLDFESETLKASGGELDMFGFDDGTRALPRSIYQALSSGRQLIENNPPLFTNGFSTEELVAMGRSLQPRYKVNSEETSDMPGLSLSMGRRQRVGVFDTGLLTSLTYGRDSEQLERKTARFNVGSGGVLAREEASRAQIAESDVRSSLSVDLTADYAQTHEVALRGLVLRHTSEEIQQKQSIKDNDSVSRTEKTSMDWVERQMFVLQLAGKHLSEKSKSPRWEWNWFAQSAEARRDQPDQIEYTYQDRGQGLEFDPSPNGNRRTWSELKDQNFEVSAAVTHRRSILNKDLQVRMGAQSLTRNRESDTWRLHLRSRHPAGTDIDLKRPIEEILDPSEIASDGFMLTSLTESADSYTGEQSQTAFYIDSEVQLSQNWIWSFGARQELSRQEVKTHYFFAPQAPTSRAGIKTSNLLPSQSLTWKPTDQWRVRLAYSESIVRPEFRELSTAPFLDNESGYETVGNDRLLGTVIRSLDHRWEFYPTPDENLTLGVFYKDFTSPIEEVFEPSPNLRKTYANAEAAQNTGIEFEGRAQLRRVSRELRRFTLMGNISLIRSVVDLDPSGLQTSDQRPLQGQSPWIANLQLQYDRPLWGTSITFLWNALGERITEVGTAGRPDIYEDAIQQFDLVASQKWDKDYSLGFKIRNILDPIVKSRQGDQVVREQRKGSVYAISISATL